jgi:hypothetical protein
MRKFEISPDETRAIVDAAGCRIVERVELYDGHHAFEIDCGTHGHKVDLLGALAEADADLPDVRRIAEDVTAGATTDAERARALHQFVKDRVSFVKEKRETFSPTLRTLEIGQGDCDDSARALMALLRAMDLPARLETLPSRASGEVPLHVAAQAQLGGRWVWLETSIDALPEEHPLAAAKRLGISTRAELASLGDPTLLDESTAWVGPALVAVAVGVLWWMSRR